MSDLGIGVPWGQGTNDSVWQQPQTRDTNTPLGLHTDSLPAMHALSIHEPGPFAPQNRSMWLEPYPPTSIGVPQPHLPATTTPFPHSTLAPAAALPEPRLTAPQTNSRRTAPLASSMVQAPVFQPSRVSPYATEFVPQSAGARGEDEDKRDQQTNNVAYFSPSPQSPKPQGYGSPGSQAQAGPSSTVANSAGQSTSSSLELFLSRDLMGAIRAASHVAAERLSPDDALFKMTPLVCGPYHSLVPLDTGDTQSATLGVWCLVFKAVSRVDLRPHALTCILPYISNNPPTPNPQQPPTRPINTPQTSQNLTIPEPQGAVEQRLSRVTHPGLVPFHHSFIDKYQTHLALFAVHTLLPGAVTLETKYELDPRSHSPHKSQFVPEDTLWALIVQILGALNAIHSAQFACKVVHPSKILCTGNNRFRLNGFGLADLLQLYDASNPGSLRHAQYDDVVCLGKVVLQVGCHSPTAHHNTGQSLKKLGQRYSPHLCEYTAQLLSSSHPAFHNARDACGSPLLLPHLWTCAEAALFSVDHTEQVLTAELESSRLCRLMMRIAFVVDRPTNDQSWSDTGDRYLLKLFHSFLFHRDDEEGHPVVDYAHVVSCLNKLDCGSDEKVMLVSRDERSVVVTTFNELRRSLQQCVGELLQMQSTGGEVFAAGLASQIGGDNLLELTPQQYWPPRQ